MPFFLRLEDAVNDGLEFGHGLRIHIGGTLHPVASGDITGRFLHSLPVNINRTLRVPCGSEGLNEPGPFTLDAPSILPLEGPPLRTEYASNDIGVCLDNRTSLASSINNSSTSGIENGRGVARGGSNVNGVYDEISLNDPEDLPGISVAVFRCDVCIIPNCGTECNFLGKQ